MKQTTSLKIAGAVLASVLAAVAARADLAINENVSFSGYAAGSVQYQKASGENTDTTMDLDSAKLAVDLNFAPISAKVSLYTDVGASELYLLDAYASYDFGQGAKLTAGRFLTYIGYEAFDVTDTNFITYGEANIFGANSMFANGIMPGYHEGAKIEYTSGKVTVGFAALDSIYGNPEGFVDPRKMFQGDGSVEDGYAFEANVTYKSEKFNAAATLGYQKNKSGVISSNPASDPYFDSPSITLIDIWAEYLLEDITIGGEIFYAQTQHDNADKTRDYYALLMVKQQLDEKLAIAARLSYGSETDWGNFWKFSVLPASYAATKNLDIRAEVAYTRYSKGARDKMADERKYEFFAGVQAVFKF